MIYLIASLVAGLIFLVSGKIKFGKTLYLEGPKARIAGLIFLAPLGLMLIVIVAGLMYAAVGNVADTEAFEQTLDGIASALVRNGFMIGLAFINFYSVSREAEDRGGCITYWLAYAVIIALLVVYFAPNITSNTPWFLNASIGITVFQIIFIIGIWLWKKWGVFGYALITFIAPFVAFLRVASISETLISFIQSLSLILVLYLLVKPKWQFFE